MKSALFIAIFFIFSQIASAQNGFFPPVTFSEPTLICDTSVWQLVLEDHFDGNQLKKPWVSFMSWKSMWGGDNDNWSAARLGGMWGDFNAIFKDENVVISKGTCKIIMKKEPSSWKCDTCSGKPLKLNYSAGAICIPYDKSFNSGKFEARIKFPVFKYAHSTIWTWAGGQYMPGVQGSMGVNEIDIAEAYGSNIGGFWGGFPRVNYSLHAWPPGAENTDLNPYQLGHHEIRNRYPQQSWWNHLTGKAFRQDEFHTYTCEWDSTRVRFYLDGKFIREIWKYYQEDGNKTIHPDCMISGTWNIRNGFPYNTTSESNLRITIGIDKEDDSHPNGFIGQMEIDYVKIWQRASVNKKQGNK